MKIFMAKRGRFRRRSAFAAVELQEITTTFGRRVFDEFPGEMIEGGFIIYLNLGMYFLGMCGICK